MAAPFTDALRIQRQYRLRKAQSGEGCVTLAAAAGKTRIGEQRATGSGAGDDFGPETCRGVGWLARMMSSSGKRPEQVSRHAGVVKVGGLPPCNG